MNEHRRTTTPRQGKNRTPAFYTKVTVDLLRFFSEQNLTPADKIVALTLILHADAEGKNAWPSMERIAEIAGIGIRTARVSIRRLEERGLVVTKKQNGRTSSYTFTHFPRAAESAEVTFPQGGRICRGGRQNLPPIMIQGSVIKSSREENRKKPARQEDQPPLPEGVFHISDLIPQQFRRRPR